MRTRLLLAAVCILTLPVWLTPSTDNKLTNSAPFVTVAIAGHVYGTTVYCECGGGIVTCVCDSGETPSGAHRGNRAVSEATNRDVSSISEAPTSDIDFGTGAMLLALMIFAWARFRT
ncbi:MAG: hypothetical protein WBV94_03680 [Blastocatellia bacterium]